MSYLVVWFVLFGVVLRHSRFSDNVDGSPPTYLSCTASLWAKNDACGIDGLGCLPFSNSSFAFRCPASCIMSGKALNPRAVGDELVNYTPFVVGGISESERVTPSSPSRLRRFIAQSNRINLMPNQIVVGDPTADQNETAVDDNFGIYRADSFICPAAIHAGIISDRYGGCGVLSQIGAASSFPSSKRNGITSISFDAAFPSAYTFHLGVPTQMCRDLRWHLLAISVTFTTVFTIVSPTACVTYFILFTFAFLHVAFASDPPTVATPYDLVSYATSRFLPAMFIAYVLWEHIFRRVHSKTFLLGNAAVEKAIFFLGGLWAGALTNITLEAMIPISRLTARDLEQQPGAKTALAIICTFLLVVTVIQIHYLRLSGQLPRMFVFYGILLISLGLLGAIPGTSLRIHHYIIGLLLLPGCRVATRPALLYQGLLLGLFINGVAKWGFAGIVETPGSLIGDGLYYTDVPKFDPPPLITDSNVTVYWPWRGKEEYDERIIGISVLVNDVQRYRWRAPFDADGNPLDAIINSTRLNSTISNTTMQNNDLRHVLPDRGELREGDGGRFTWKRSKGEKLYVRIGYVGVGDVAMDYTQAGVVEANGVWSEPPPGWS